MPVSLRIVMGPSVTICALCHGNSCHGLCCSRECPCIAEFSLSVPMRSQAALSEHEHAIKRPCLMRPGHSRYSRGWDASC